MKRRSFKINEQGSDGEEVSDEEQHQADIESENMAVKQQAKYRPYPGCRRVESP